ncbi:MAG: hypothetical protein ACI9FB_002566 [Candidatus Azotimanducaceae bacterium]|jgi:hypothetical protein
MERRRARPLCFYFEARVHFVILVKQRSKRAQRFYALFLKACTPNAKQSYLAPPIISLKKGSVLWKTIGDIIRWTLYVES